MARMYSRKRGKSGSKKPIRKIAPTWLKYKPAEVEKLVLKISKEGKDSALIGTILRDSYGIPSVKSVTGKKVVKVLAENKAAPKLPEDLANLVKRVISITRHIETNKKDEVAKRGLIITESKIRRLVKYYKRKNRLPEGWNYSRTSMKTLLN